jgi:hypothetical protein
MDMKFETGSEKLFVACPNVKGKDVPMKTYWGSESTAPPILDPDTRWR